MKLLLDANLSPRLVGGLVVAGHEAVHVGDVGLLTASDDAIFAFAAEGSFVVVTSDSDFPMMLALRRAKSPSVLLLRHVAELGTTKQGHLITANLASIAQDLETGAVVSLSPTRLAVRRLPIG